MREPEERLTAFQALEHKWVQEGGSAEDLPLGGSVVRSSSYHKLYIEFCERLAPACALRIEFSAHDGSVTALWQGAAWRVCMSGWLVPD